MIFIIAIKKMRWDYLCKTSVVIFDINSGADRVVRRRPRWGGWREVTPVRLSNPPGAAVQPLGWTTARAASFGPISSGCVFENLFGPIGTVGQAIFDPGVPRVDGRARRTLAAVNGESHVFQKVPLFLADCAFGLDF